MMVSNDTKNAWTHALQPSLFVRYNSYVIVLKFSNIFSHQVHLSTKKSLYT